VARGEPRRFGRYVLLERIAVGGMAEIFKAKTESIGGFEKTVAIKRLHAHYSEDEDFVRMLLDEARIAALLNHSGVVQIYDAGVVGSHYYIAMEYVHGQSAYGLLRAVYARKTVLPIALACHIAGEVAMALHHAHAVRDASGAPARIVHRDVSPQNVLLSYEGDVKVVDFGIAKAAMRSTRTQSGVIKGKFYYMAPEHARGERVDHRSDIFANGILLYELLTTHACYDEDDNAVLLEKVKNADFPPPRTHRPDMPEALQDIVLKAMASDPDKRYQTARDMAWDLMRFLKSAGLHPTRLHLREYMRRLFVPEVKADLPGAEPSSAGESRQSEVLLPASIAVAEPRESTNIIPLERSTDPELRPAQDTGQAFAESPTHHHQKPRGFLRRAIVPLYAAAAALAVANLVVWFFLL